MLAGVSVHGADLLGLFFAPTVETVTVWARDTAAQTKSITYARMEFGDGERFRPDTAAGRYRCPIDDCGSLLDVKAGPIKRHHWAHRRGSDVQAHSPESMWHLAAKAALARLARDQFPKGVIDVDSMFSPAGRRADVWVRDSDADVNVAFEAQLSPLPAMHLTRRTTDYQQVGIVPVWLFGHRKAPIPVPDDDHMRVRLTEAHRATLKAGLPLRWLNPDTGQVATAYVREQRQLATLPGERWPIGTHRTVEDLTRPRSQSRACLVAIDALSDCRIDATGLHTPTDDRIDANAKTAEQHLRALARDRFTASAPTSALTPESQGDMGHFLVTTVKQDRSPRTNAPTYDPHPSPVRERGHTPSDCPYCHNKVEPRSTWPDWYRPSATATAAYTCTVCELIVGSG